MFLLRATIALLTAGAALGMSGCSGDSVLGSSFGGPGTTASIPEKPKANPQCVTLAAQIEGLRREGVAERVEQAAKGKGETVSMKRASLAKVAELNALNTEFQNKCSTFERPAGMDASAPVKPVPAQAAAASPKVKSASATKPQTAQASAKAQPEKTE